MRQKHDNMVSRLREGGELHKCLIKEYGSSISLLRDCGKFLKLKLIFRDCGKFTSPLKECGNLKKSGLLHIQT